jgi:primosomal protein N'
VVTIAHILLTHAAHDTEGYSYIVPLELIDILSVGMLVEVEFGDALAHGILAGFASVENPPEGIKPILRSLTPALLTGGMIAAILEYARKHMIHVHKVLALFLPTPCLRRILKYWLSNPEYGIWLKPPSPTQSIIYASNKQEILQYARVAISLPGTVVIVPSDPWIGEISEWVDMENMGVLTSQMTDIRKSQYWIDVQGGKYSTLIWTRRLALYNLSRYQRVIYLEESLFPQILGYFHSYAVRDLLQTIAVADGLTLEYVSATPSIDLAARAIAHQLPLNSIRHALPHETPLAPGISTLP